MENEKQLTVYIWTAGPQVAIHCPEKNTSIVSYPRSGRFNKVTDPEHLQIISAQVEHLEPATEKEAELALKELAKFT